MGGDYAPKSVVKGVAAASKIAINNTKLVLVGIEDEIHGLLSKMDRDDDRIEVVHASEVVTMVDSPVAAIRRKTDSSIARLVDLLNEKKVDGIFSAGNTGAFVAAAKLKLKSLPGVERPALASVLPNLKGLSVLIDAGANSDCRPSHLIQFAIMGSIYAREALGKENPTVGLMNIGEEATKGNELTREVFKLLENKHLNFLGNIEGRDVLNGKADVILCDGFVGNIILKISESLAFAFHKILEEEVLKRPLAALGSLLMRPAFKALIKKTDYAEYGGVPLLGVNGVCVVGHGNSSSKAIKNAINVAQELVNHRINKLIVDEINA
jgi:phosphate acyltransferase